MTDELRTKFDAVDESLSMGLTEYSAGKQFNNPDMENSGLRTVTGLKTQIDDVEQAVQRCLHYDEA